MDKLKKEELISEVTHRIESNFNDSIVRWVGTGIPDEDDADVERFEVLWITDEDYSRFRDFVWDLEVNLAEPNGFALMVHCLSPKATQEHRLKEYLSANNEKLSKNISYTIRIKWAMEENPFDYSPENEFDIFNMNNRLSEFSDKDQKELYQKYQFAA